MVLICAVELCSLHYQYGGDAGKLVANALFADAPRHWLVVPAGARNLGASSPADRISSPTARTA